MNSRDIEARCAKAREEIGLLNDELYEAGERATLNDIPASWVDVVPYGGEMRLRIQIGMPMED